MVRPTPVQLHRNRLLPIAATTVLVVAASAGLASASAAQPNTPGPSTGGRPSAATPTVSGPVTGGLGAIVPANLNLLDLSKVGYRSAEYFLSGTAHAYSNSAPLNAAGNWSIAPASTAPYKTRIVVFQPSNPKKFNGTVVVEWLNVSGGVDANPDWTQTHNELIREGAVWVGVSAQAAGIAQLQCSTTAPPSLQCPGPGDPARYGSLVHPGDSYSYDMFSQAGQALRAHYLKILGPRLKPKVLLAAGESQSAGRMVTYIDAVQPLVNEYNGFLVHSRSAVGAGLSQAPLTAIAAPNPTLIRADLKVPVFTFQTETDIGNFGGYLARQPDTNVFRQWEAAGTSHFDTYGLLIGPTDIGDGQGAIANIEAMQNPTTSPSPGSECAQPINTGGAHWLLNSAIYWLNKWVTKGTQPPVGQPLQIATTSPFAYAIDSNGNTIGGVRSPQVDAPIATLGTNNVGVSGPLSNFCFLFGSTVPFTPTQLSALYPNQAHFVTAWDRATSKLVKSGFILQADQKELDQSALHAQIP